MRILLLVAMLAAGCATQSPVPSMNGDAASLAAAESAFAAHSVREDMRVAFMANFAPDGMYVRKGWVVANDDLASRTAPPIVLDWRPVHTEVAASGDMGLSTGPWKLTSKTDPTMEANHGQFVSIWKRKDGGPWKVAVDIGISNPGTPLWDAPLEAMPADAAAARDASGLDAAEKNFQVLSRSGLAPYLAFASHRIRIYREGAAPVIGSDAAFKTPALSSERFVWTVERSEIANSGEFGYARGRYASMSAPDKVLGYFLRVWRLEDGHWHIVMDVINPAS